MSRILSSSELQTPPITGRIISAILAIFLGFLGYTTFKFKSQLINKPNNNQKKKSKESSKNQKNLSHHHIQRIEVIKNYSLYKPSQVDFTLIIPFQNFSGSKYQYISDIYEYLSIIKKDDPQFTFEIFVLISFDEETGEISKFINPNVHYFGIKTNETAEINILRKISLYVHGSAIFYFIPSDHILFSQIKIYIDKYRQCIYDSKELMIIGAIPDSVRLQYPSTLHYFCSKFSSFFWRHLGIGKRAQFHCHSIIVSQSALRLIIRNLQFGTYRYDTEFLYLSVINNIDIHSVKLQADGILTSSDRSQSVVQTAIDQFFLIFLYYFLLVKRFINKLLLNLF